MEQFILIAAFAGLVIALAASITCVQLGRKLRELKINHELLAADADHRLQEARQHLEALARQVSVRLQQLSQQAKPVQRAETRAPQPTVATVPVPAQTGTLRQSVTERRHRVLTLARRGMDVRAIAQTLGMPQGEVGLIIRMSNPQFGD